MGSYPDSEIKVCVLSTNYSLVQPYIPPALVCVKATILPHKLQLFP